MRLTLVVFHMKSKSKWWVSGTHMQMVLPSMTNIKAASRKVGKTSEKIKVS